MVCHNKHHGYRIGNPEKELNLLISTSLKITTAIRVVYPHFHGFERRNYLAVNPNSYNFDKGVIAFRDANAYYVTILKLIPNAADILEANGFRQESFPVAFTNGEYPADRPHRLEWGKMLDTARPL